MQTAFNYQAYHVTIKGNEFGYKVVALPDYEGEVLRHHFTGFLL